MKRWSNGDMDGKRRNLGFDISAFYDYAVHLDEDFYSNLTLSSSEVDSAITLIGKVPETVFLPCVGTGRHIPRLLEYGVSRIVGVDISKSSLDLAALKTNGDARVVLKVADLSSWRPTEQFDAVMLLGNSFGDVLEESLLQNFVHALVLALDNNGTFVMDYVGENYLAKYGVGYTPEWLARVHDQTVVNSRSLEYDELTSVLTVNTAVLHPTTRSEIKQLIYKKLILSRSRIKSLFAYFNVVLNHAGTAIELNQYVAKEAEALGMIGVADWWLGHKLF